MDLVRTPELSFGLFSSNLFSFCLLCSRPEDCGHQEEAAAVHRTLQVFTQFPESLVCLHHPGLCRPRQPGQRSHGLTETNHKPLLHLEILEEET